MSSIQVIYRVQSWMLYSISVPFKRKHACLLSLDPHVSALEGDPNVPKRDLSAAVGDRRNRSRDARYRVRWLSSVVGSTRLCKVPLDYQWA